MTAFIFPMAGYGTRVAALGNCKPLLNVAGKMVISWCLFGLKEVINQDDEFHFVVREEDIYNHDITARIRESLWTAGLSNPIFFHITHKVLAGPLLSVGLAVDEIPGNADVIICNTDQFISFDRPKYASGMDGFCVAHTTTNPKSSYIDAVDNGNGWMLRSIKEKSPISFIGSSGVYGFRSVNLLRNCIDKALKKKPHHNAEYFVGPAMMELAGDILLVPAKFKFDLGSVDNIRDYEQFVNKVCKTEH